MPGMRVVRHAAQTIRHLPGLDRADWLWKRLRAPYHRVLGAGGRGVEVLVGGSAPVRMPPEYAGGSWEAVEPKTVAAFAGWVRRHPGATVVDVGSSVGIFSAVALFADATTNVIAFDGDLASLAAVRRMCSHATGNRLSVVHGFVTDSSGATGCSLDEATSATDRALKASAGLGDVGTTRYVSLLDPATGDVPAYRLDDLIARETLHGRPTLIKCDVEGAELLVLMGAQNLLSELRPALLLSVHPPALPDYGHSPALVAGFLTQMGYTIHLLERDHEEHWSCEALSPV